MITLTAVISHWTALIGEDLIRTIFALILLIFWVNIFIDRWI